MTLAPQLATIGAQLARGLMELAAIVAGARVSLSARQRPQERARGPPLDARLTLDGWNDTLVRNVDELPVGRGDTRARGNPHDSDGKYTPHRA